MWRTGWDASDSDTEDYSAWFVCLHALEVVAAV